MKKMIRSMLAVVVSLGLGSVAMGSPKQARACDSETAASAPIITHREAKDSLGALLRSRGLAQPTASEVVVRNYELDGDPNTAEALVDVIAVELCVGGCTTIVVRETSSGLVAMGHGKFLVPASSKSCGWSDLIESALPFLTARVLRFVNGSYE